MNNMLEKIIESNRKVLLKENHNIKREDFDFLYTTLQSSNIVLVGIRQIGKTTLSEQLAKKYAIEKYNDKELKSIFYLNFNYFNGEISELLDEVSKEKYKIILLDEIQTLDSWSRKCQALIDFNKDKKFIISGSNLQMLTSELMVNRARTFNINPLTFNEYKTLWQDDSLVKFLMWGSYPPFNKENDVETQYYKYIDYAVINKIILEDNQFSDLRKDSFILLMQKINNHIGNPLKISALEDVKFSRNTAKSYLQIAENARIVKRIKKYKDTSEKAISKVYYVDKSLINRFNDYKPLNNNLIGSLVENEVFCHLDNLYNKEIIDSNIYFYNNSNKKEIDFIIPREKLLIEVKYATSVNWGDLVNSLNNTISSELDSYTKIIVTKNSTQVKDGWYLISLELFLSKSIEENIKRLNLIQ